MTTDGTGSPSLERSCSRAVASQGWGSAAGREAVEVMRRACRREAAHWTRTAGWLTDEGLAVVWEQMDHLVKAGRFDDAPGLLRVVVRRAYAGEAAAAQTGVGSPTTRGLIAAIRSSAAAPIGQIGVEDTSPAAEDPPSLVAPPWMRTLAAVLAVRGLGVAGAAVARGDGVRGRGGAVGAAVPVGDGRPPTPGYRRRPGRRWTCSPSAPARAASRSPGRRGCRCRSICSAPPGSAATRS